MRPIILVAAGGLARETLEVVRAAGADHVVGMVDDDASRWGELVGGVEVLGGLDVVHERPEVSVVLCAGRGSAREHLAERLGLPDHRYAVVRHPSVQLPDSCAVGAGSIVLAGVVLTADVRVGRHVVAMPNVTLTHDDTVDDFATLAAGSTLGGSVHVGSGAYLGMHAAVRENCRIGARSVVGMGAVVLDDVPPDQTWIGVPARPARTRSFRSHAVKAAHV